MRISNRFVVRLECCGKSSHGANRANIVNLLPPTVEQHYQAQMDALTPRERMARSVAMLAWTRQMLARQIVAECGPMSPERLKWEVALRQYGDDPIARTTIEQQLAHVSD